MQLDFVALRRAARKNLWCAAAPWAVAWALSGCSSVLPAPEMAPAPPPPPIVLTFPVVGDECPAPGGFDISTPAVETSPVLDTLARTDLILRMGSPELAREIARLSEMEEAAAGNPLLLATALAQTRQPADTARALGLVQRLLANPTEAARVHHALARMMEARLLQQRRLEEQLERQAVQLRDLQRRNDQLNERLEAVRAIERSLTVRNPSAPGNASTAPPGSAQRPAP